MKKLGLAAVAGAFLIGTLAAQEFQSDADDRVALALTPPERGYVLGQMRLFVESIQSIAAALAKKDRVLANDAAAARGAKRNADDPAFPPTLRAKLPEAWKQFGGNTRRGFDRLAQGIAENEDLDHSLQQLSEVMKNCTGCHTSYRIVNSPL